MNASRVALFIIKLLLRLICYMGMMAICMTLVGFARLSDFSSIDIILLLPAALFICFLQFGVIVGIPAGAVLGLFFIWPMWSVPLWHQLVAGILATLIIPFPFALTHYSGDIICILLVVPTIFFAEVGVFAINEFRVGNSHK